MTSGKIASQAGHAYLSTFLAALASDTLRAATYHGQSFSTLADFTAPTQLGTKVCLGVDSLDRLDDLHFQFVTAGLPTFKVVDEGHSSFCHGQPTVTALGVGPAQRHEIHEIIRRLRLIP